MHCFLDVRDPHVDLDVQTCLLKLSEVLFKPSDETAPPKLALAIPISTGPPPEILTPTLPKIRIPVQPVPSSAVEPPVDPRQYLTDFFSTTQSHKG